ncbi:MAG: tRNA guanosine(34) transglycosylase Tgt [Candidatus Liptonbacteria bacterium]
MFEIVHKDQNTSARLGRLTTPHGIVETPSYVIVGTHGEVRCLEPEDIPRTKTQLIISNTYHLWRSFGDEELSSYEGLHADMKWNGPIMTDSGGFQVFSHGALRELGSGKIYREDTNPYGSGESVVRVTDSGVYFEEDGEELYLDAELSMRIQEQLGADIIFAFDEPSSPLHDYEYTKLAMARTHAWARRSLEAKTSDQKIYGIVQGGKFEDLRKMSAEFIGAMSFDGFGVGGSFGSSYGGTAESILRELKWTVPFLPEHKPRHLLGMGKVHDVFAAVEAGIDTFDCVIPTREARHGRLWTAEGPLNILRGAHEKSGANVEPDCDCPVCGIDEDEHTTRAELYRMFKEKNPQAGRLATMHNVYFFNNLLEQIRGSMRENGFGAFKAKYLERFERGEKEE